jgi:hypothetical protein
MAEVITSLEESETEYIWPNRIATRMPMRTIMKVKLAFPLGL